MSGSPASESSRRGRLRVMVVEDERIIALATCLMIKGMGHEVCACVHSGEKAVQETTRDRPDLILMDIMLEGGIDGIEAAMMIQKDQDIPVAYVTAYSDADTRRKADCTNYVDFVSKPLDEPRLRAIIQRLAPG